MEISVAPENSVTLNTLLNIHSLGYPFTMVEGKHNTDTMTIFYTVDISLPYS